MTSRHSGAACAMYLQVEVKAGGCGVPICHTLQCHIVSFYERVLSDDLEGDVLCGVCADKMGGRWVVKEWRACEVECVPPTARWRDCRDLWCCHTETHVVVLPVANLYAAEHIISVIFTGTGLDHSSLNYSAASETNTCAQKVFQQMINSTSGTAF